MTQGGGQPRFVNQAAAMGARLVMPQVLDGDTALQGGIPCFIYLSEPAIAQ
jgi:hypothetical protein